MEHRRARVRSRGGGAIDRGLHCRSEPVERGTVRPRRVGGRHHAGADLPHHLLPRRRLAPRLRNIESIERKASCTHPRVVTGDTVAIDHRLRSRSRLRALSRGQGLAGWRGTRRSVWVSTLASANTNSAAAASMRAFMAWPTQPSAFRAGRSSPACAPHRLRRERRPLPSGAASVLPCP